jgi:hypothetical protein
MKRRGELVLMGTWLFSVIGAGQNLVWQDSVVLLRFRNPIDPGVTLVKFRFTQELEYSFTLSNMLFLNWSQGNGSNQAAVLHHFKYRSKLNHSGNLSISASFNHILGIQCFFDSISRFQPDDNTLDTRIEIRLRKNVTFSVLSNLTTRIFNAWDYSSDQTGNLIRTLNSSFLTPLLCTFSAGVGWTFPGWGTINLGMSAGKFTLVRNSAVYDEMGVTEFFGVPKDRKFLFEYGMTLHLLIDRNFLNRVQWNCDVLIFKNYEMPVDLVLKNLVGIRINKFLRTTIQTRFFYEEETSKNFQVENLVTVGFYFLL